MKVRKIYIMAHSCCDSDWASEASPTLGWGVQSRFRVIYIYMYVCMYVCRCVLDCRWENNTKKLYAKMRGRDYIVQTCTCLKNSFGFLKQSAD